MPDRPASIDDVVSRMDTLLAPLEKSDDPRQYFLATYRRTTLAVRDHIRQGHFSDPEWVERWDIEFASLYLDAVESWNSSGQAPGPWREAFAAAGQGPRLPPLRHTLLGMNAHINWDLPQAVLVVMTDDEIADPDVVERRRGDHGHIDEVLVSRVEPEDKELAKVEQPGDRTWLDRLLTPFNRAGTKRFLKEARRKVWRNTQLLSAARREGPDALAARLSELETLSKSRIADLRAPGQVILRLSIKGFGVQLPETRR